MTMVNSLDSLRAVSKHWKPYPAYKPSGVEWLGDIPAHWEVRRLKQMVRRIGSGKTPKGGAEVYSQSGVMFLRSQNIHFDGLRLDDIVYIDESIDAEMASTRVHPQDVLLNITGASLGRCSIVPDDLESANVNQHVCIVRPNTGLVNPKFLHRAISSDILQTQIFAGENGTSREGLTFSQVGNLVLVAPWDSGEQHSIATFLDRETARLDALIAKHERLIELLQEKRTALISHTVTKGLDPSAPRKDSGTELYPSVPQHWRILRLRYLCREVADGPHFSPAYLDDGIMFLSARNVKVDGWSLDDAKYVSTDDYEEFCKRVIPEVDDILYTKGGTTGVARVVDLTVPFHVWVHIAVLKLRREIVNPYFLAYVLNGVACYGQSQIYTRGATNNDLGLTRLINIVLAIPTLDEQARIVAYLNRKTAKLDALIARVREGIEKLREYRTALISAAVTGKIDVRVS